MNPLDWIRSSNSDTQKDDRVAVVTMDMEQFILSTPGARGQIGRRLARMIAREVLRFMNGTRYGD